MSPESRLVLKTGWQLGINVVVTYRSPHRWHTVRRWIATTLGIYFLVVGGAGVATCLTLLTIMVNHGTPLGQSIVVIGILAQAGYAVAGFVVGLRLLRGPRRLGLSYDGSGSSMRLTR